MGLRDKYSYAVQTAKDRKMQGSAEEREGKLYFKGTTRDTGRGQQNLGRDQDDT